MLYYSNGTNNKKVVLSQTLPRDVRDHTIWQYAHGLLLESWFVPSSTDCLTVRAKIAISVAVEAKPELEIWRRSKKLKERWRLPIGPAL